MEKSSKFRSGKYGGQFTGVQNSTLFSLRKSWMVLAGVGKHQILVEDVVAIPICPLDPGDHMLSEKALVDIDLTHSLTPMTIIGHFWPLLPTTPSTICFRGTLKKGNDVDAWIHVSHREAVK